MMPTRTRFAKCWETILCWYLSGLGNLSHAWRRQFATVKPTDISHPLTSYRQRKQQRKCTFTANNALHLHFIAIDKLFPKVPFFLKVVRTTYPHISVNVLALQSTMQKVAAIDFLDPGKLNDNLHSFVLSRTGMTGRKPTYTESPERKMRCIAEIVTLPSVPVFARSRSWYSIWRLWSAASYRSLQPMERTNRGQATLRLHAHGIVVFQTTTKVAEISSLTSKVISQETPLILLTTISIKAEPAFTFLLRSQEEKQPTVSMAFCLSDEYSRLSAAAAMVPFEGKRRP